MVTTLDNHISRFKTIATLSLYSEQDLIINKSIETFLLYVYLLEGRSTVAVDKAHCISEWLIISFYGSDNQHSIACKWNGIYPG